MALPTFKAFESGIALLQRIKVKMSVPLSREVNPLLSSTLSGIKTSITLLNINMSWIWTLLNPLKGTESKSCHLKALFHQITELKGACLLYNGHTVNYFFISIS